MEKTVRSAAEFHHLARKTSPPLGPGKKSPNYPETSEVRKMDDPAPGPGSLDRDVPAILLVSNDDYFRPMVRAYLEHVGFAVISCTDARRAREIGSTTPRLGLLLLDVTSSGMEGLQTALELDAMPAIIMSGTAFSDDEARIIDHHGWKLLNEPLRLPELLAAIRHVFDRDKLHQASYAGSPARTPKVVPIPPRGARRSASIPSALSSNNMPLIWPTTQGDHRRP